MELKGEYILREIAGDAVLIPTGKSALDFNGIIALNEVSADIWKCLQDGYSKENILEYLLEQYEVERETVSADLNDFLAQLHQLGILDLSE